MYRDSIATTALLSLLAGTAGCVTPDDAAGSLGVAVQSQGDDGATYRLPAGSRLSMQSDAYYDEFSLDGNQAVVSFDVPVGNYQAALVHDNGYTLQWPLERELGGTLEVVSASLVTTMPAPVAVTSGGQSALVLAFSLPDGDTITFDQGTVDVSVDIDHDTPAGYALAMTGTVDILAAGVSPEAPPELAARWPADGATGIQVAVSGRIAGPWTQPNSTWACAPLEIQARSSSHAALNDHLQQSYDGVTPPGWAGPASLCTYTLDDSTSYVRLRMSARAPGTTPTFQDLGAAAIEFVTLLQGPLPAPAFDGETLDMDVLLGSTAIAPVRMVTRVNAFDSADVGTQWVNGFAEGPATLDVTGTF